MTARTPADVDRLFAEAISRGDVDGALACSEDGASLVPQPGQVVRGTAALREAVGGLVALKGPLEISVEEVVEAGEIALLRSRWTLRGTGQDGQPLELAGAGAEVVRRQADGSWRFVIDHPFAAMPPASA
jgi:ketosteroid isomerase-like protein